MLLVQNLTYSHPNKDVLFENFHLTVNAHQKIALIGNNGAGKSTLLKIIAGELPPSVGQVQAAAPPYYIPQVFGQYHGHTIAQALNVEAKLRALHQILQGAVTEENYQLLQDDWTIEERCAEALAYWQLNGLDLAQTMDTLSGGQQTKVFLAGLSIHQPGLALLDEPTNHLDLAGRQLLYGFIRSTKNALIVVSHDRKLLQLFDSVCELGPQGLVLYGGNYDFYREQKQLQHHALTQDLQSREKALRKAKEKERDTLERQQKLNSRGRGKQEKAGVARIMMNTLRNNAENSTAKLKSAHADKIEGISQEVQDLRAALPALDQMKFGFAPSGLHKGKILFSAAAVNFSYGPKALWAEPLSFQVTSGERLALKGGNGSGKTTLVKIILGDLEPHTGTVYRAGSKTLYMDQDYSLIDNSRTVYNQAGQFNDAALHEHEIKIRLTRFLFTREDWDKPCSALSGGERMRLMLCCLTLSRQAPDLIVLDEPTNNLDLQNLDILTTAVNEYEGALIVVSHDETFLEQVKVERTLQL